MLIAGGSAPAPWVTLLCLSKEESPEERTPRSARLLPPFLAPPGAHQLAGRTLRASGSNTGSLNYSRWGCGTRRALRGFENPNPWRWVFFIPVWRTRAPPGFGRAPAGAQTGMSAPAPPRQDVASGQRGPQSRGGEDQGAIRGVLSLVSFFARAKKETRPRCGEPPLAFSSMRGAHVQIIPVGQPSTSKTRPQAARE
jgi:hypothetical protein